jgi:hypothetical protein
MDDLEKSLPAHCHQIRQNGDPETAATVAQLVFALYHNMYSQKGSTLPT